MNNKGFTVIEVIVSFALVALISTFLFQVVLSLKTVFLMGDIKTTLLIKQGNMVEKIYNDLDNHKLTTVTECDNNEVMCKKLVFDDKDRILKLDTTNKLLIYDDYTIKLDDGITYDSMYHVISSGSNILHISLPLHHKLMQGDFGIDIVYDINHSGERTTVEEEPSGSKGVIKSGALKTAASKDDTHKGTIFLDPTNLMTECTDKNTSIGKGTEGCLKFYIMFDKNDNYTLILDHNLTSNAAWNSKKETTIGEIKTELEKATKDWTGNPRLPYANEIAEIIGATSDKTLSWDSAKSYGTNVGTQTSWLCLDGGRNSNPTVYASGSNGWQKQYTSSKIPSIYAWLFDYTNGCQSYGCTTADSSNYGYWTNDYAIGTTARAWRVSNKGRLGDDDETSTSYGARPVITISKNIIKE